MYNTVLVPVDLDEKGYTDKVIEHALHLLKPGGNLILLTALAGYQMPLVGSFFPADAFEKAVKKVRKKLIDFVNNDLPIDSQFCSIKVVQGKPTESILSVAKSSQVEVIVMASHKQSRMDYMMLGSTANKVLNQTNIPVMVIKG